MNGATSKADRDRVDFEGERDGNSERKRKKYKQPKFDITEFGNMHHLRVLSPDNN